MRIRVAYLVLCTCLAVAIAAPLSADSEMVTVVRLSDSIEIGAPPAKVWATMTAGDLSWCPYWKADENNKKALKKVGDAMVFNDDWGNGGHSVVTYFAANSELRIAHEPENGSYMCQSKIMLEEAEGGTKVTYIEQYTDESSEADRDATAKSMSEAVTKTLMTLKRMAEKM